jgi:chromosome segregation ATPase
MKTKLSPALQLEAMLSGKTKTHRTGNKMEMLNQKIKELELKLESANERINQLKEELMDAKNKYAALVADVALYEDRGERIKRLEEVGDVAQSQGGQAVSVEERILFLAESPDCNHPRELRAIAFQVRKLEDRIKQLESENDALRADLLLWEEKEAKP